MKNLYKYISVSVLAMAGLNSCHNADIEFDDFEDGVSVYFPYQMPIRTLCMGEDEYNTDRDNNHQCLISATMGGSYKGKNITVNIAVDESLCNNVYKPDGVTPVSAMPASYYQLSSNTINFDGDMAGSVVVTLSDEFFNDPKSVAEEYVIPVVMTSQTGADRILTGEYDSETNPTAPSRLSDKWSVAPKDYTLFCVTYISKYEGFFLRRITNIDGKDSIHTATLPELPDYPVVVSNYRFKQGTDSIRKYSIEPANEPIVSTKTVNLNKVTYTASVNGTDYHLVLDFASGQVAAAEGETYTATGTCEYRDHSEKKAWGNKDRDGLYLTYTVSDGTESHTVNETLVLQRRGITIKTEENGNKYVVKE